MPRKFLRKYLPDADTVRSNRMVAPFASWLHHPNLWHLNRKSVPGAVAIGLACGLIPGPLQMLGALLLAIPLKKNLPVALLLTLYTNPFTIVPLYVLAYGYGQLAMLLRARFCNPAIRSVCKTDGLAFRIKDIVTGVEKHLAGVD